MAITGLASLIDLITPAEAKLEPLLAGVDAADARLVQLITTCSYQIQRWLGYVYAATANVPADVKLACSTLLVLRWTEDAIADGGDMESESLGQYSYNRRNQVAVEAKMKQIMGLLIPHRQRTIPVQVFNRETSATLTEDRD